MFSPRIIIGICKLCRGEHGAALLEVLTLPELQPSDEPIAVREPETSLSSLQEQPNEVSFILSILGWFSYRDVGKQTHLHYTAFIVMYIFVNSIGNANSTTSSRGRPCRRCKL